MLTLGGDQVVPHGHLGLAGAHKTQNKNRMASSKRAADCTASTFYKYPTSSTVVSTNELEIQWDPSCLDAKTVVIYLYNPSASTPRVYTWSDVPFSKGSLTRTLNPSWWGNAQTASLYLSIVDPDQPAFMAKFPQGPTFNVTYSGSSSSSTSNAGTGSVEDVGAAAGTGGISKGGIAAAVLVPIIFIALVVAGVFVKMMRARQKREREEARVNIDRRMSRISQDWKSITPSGASAAVRASMAGPGNRASSFSFGAIRPASTVAVEGGQAGIGARGFYTHAEHGSTDSGPVYGIDGPQMAQLRPGVRASAFEERRSRAISFADQARPSLDSRKTVVSRAFHTGAVPPLPTRTDSEYSAGELSPTQAHGPLALEPEDIRARLAGSAEPAPRASVDAVLPALALMRQGGAGAAAEDALIAPPPPPAPAHTEPEPLRSPILGAMPMPPLPAAALTPDELLRAYAARSGAATPVDANGMRVLHGNADEEDPYGGTTAH